MDNENGKDARIDRTNTLLARIRNLIDKYFKASGLMQKALSERTGIKPSQLCRVLHGKRTLYADELILLIVALDIPLQELFGPELWREYECRMIAKGKKVF